MNTAPRFVNFHILHPVPFSNPNRDDTGAPKTTTFGGTIRGRMSSQSDKRASRLAFEGGSDADRTDRTKFAARHLADKVSDLLEADGRDLDDKARAKLDKDLKKELDKLTGAKETAKATLVWIAEDETNKLAEKIANRHVDGGDLSLGKDDIDAVLSPQTESLTIAAFGRMFANRADLQMEAAAQVGHAFTTHTQQVDLDYFTAVDDLQASYDEPDAEGRVKGAGAGHLDINEFHSGVFYRYFNVNRHDLKSNWMPLARTDDDAPARLAEFLTAMIFDLPDGRESTAAHQTIPAHVLVTFSRRGHSYAPAFDHPVVAEGDSGHVRPSVEALTSYADKATRIDGTVHRLAFDLDDTSSQPLDEIVNAAAAWLAGDDGPVASLDPA